ncbi:hypothetical protein D3C78_1155660 [compost metagenome]
MAFFVRTARDGQPPGNQRRGIFWPALHDRDTGQIDRIAFEDFLLTRRTAQAFGRHVQHLFELRQFIEQIAEAFWWLRLFQKREQFADFTQRRHVFLPHAHRHAFRRAEQVTQHRHGIAFRIFKQQRRATGTQCAVSNFCHFQIGINRKRDAFEFALLFQQRQEVA